MYHGRKVKSKRSHFHEKILCIAYKNNALLFEELSEFDKSFKIHRRNIESYAIEFFKIKNNLSVTIINDILQPRAVSFNKLSSQIDCTKANANSKHIGINSRRYMTGKVWDLVPNGIGNVNNNATF